MVQATPLNLLVKSHLALLLCNIIWACDYPFYNLVLSKYVAPIALVIIRKSKCSTDFKRNDFLKKTKRTHWVRFVHLNSLIESCVFLYLWNSPFDTFL